MSWLLLTFELCSFFIILLFSLGTLLTDMFTICCSVFLMSIAAVSLSHYVKVIFLPGCVTSFPAQLTRYVLKAFILSGVTIRFSVNKSYHSQSSISNVIGRLNVLISPLFLHHRYSRCDWDHMVLLLCKSPFSWACQCVELSMVGCPSHLSCFLIMECGLMRIIQVLTFFYLHW